MEEEKYRVNINGDPYGLAIGDHASVTLNIYPQTFVGTSASYRSIIGMLPLTDPSEIQQRTTLVETIFTRLLHPDTNALVLTGIGGIGKSTLAALLYRFVEAKHSEGRSPFAVQPLWLSIDVTTTFADLMGTICQAFNTPMPDLGSFTPASQALVLYNVLDQTKYPRLIVLDQFENLLDWKTGKALENRSGVGEWLDALNSRRWKSGCRLVMTSRPRPRGKRQETAVGIQEYPVEGLTQDEGMDLLRKRGIQDRDADLSKAVKACNGHGLSLELLVTLLQTFKMPLTTLFENMTSWSSDIAENLLDAIFEKLSEEQKNLLRAFSIYRIPVPVEAAQAIFPMLQQKQVFTSLQTLLAQHLVQAAGEGYYQLHIIVGTYANQHFEQASEENNKYAVIQAHEKAAQYYKQQAAMRCPPQNQRRRVDDVRPLLEAIWHFCQATQWQQAYNLMVHECVFVDLKSWGNYVDLLSLYELMLPLERWRPDDQQSIHIYNDLGRLYSDFDNKKQALEWYKRALEICEGLGDNKQQARTLNNLGWIHLELGEWEQASKYLKQALNISREAADYRREASTLNGLGRLSDCLGKKELAREYYEQALLIYSKTRERSMLKGEAWTFNNLGKVYADLGDVEQALEYFQKALSIRKNDLNNLWEEGRTIKNIGEVYLLQGKVQEALKCLEEALFIAQKVGDLRGKGRTLAALGRSYHALTEEAKSLVYFEQALRIHREVSDHRYEARTLADAAALLSDLSGQQDQAIKNYETALEIYRRIGDRWGEEIILQKLAIYPFQQNSND